MSKTRRKAHIMIFRAMQPFEIHKNVIISINSICVQSTFEKFQFIINPRASFYFVCK